MKLTSVIVEDEALSRKILETYCEKSGLVNLMGSFASADEALVYLNAHEVQVLFLDVEMPGIDGFELLDNLLYMPKIIFTTSKTEYAFKAFEYDVVDYLKKPVQYSRFLSSLHKITEAASETQKPSGEEDFYIKSSGKFVRLRYKDVLYIESLGDYVKYITDEKAYVTHSTMKMVEEKMGPHNFMKVHRSFIVNLHKIKDIEDYTLVISGKVIPMSKALKAEVLKRLNIV
jgi:DNA-binding LytR/AlgR family response regulator